MKPVARYGVCIILGAVVAITGGCGNSNEGRRPAEQIPVVHGVAVSSVTAVSLADEVEMVGTVRPRTSAIIAARISGTVMSVHVREGDRVSRGKLLVRIDSIESVAGAAGAEAAVEEAKRAVDEAIARKRLADVTFERFNQLHGEQAVTRQEFDSKMTERDLAQQGLARAEASLHQARESSRGAAAVAGYTLITAPIAGVVTSKTVDPGMTVFPGMPFMTIEAEGGYRLEAAVAESLAGFVHTGQKVRTVLAGSAAESVGTVAEIVPTADPASRTIIAKVDVRGDRLKSGMYGRIFLPVAERKVLVVPQNAIVERGSLTSVWVVDSHKIARMRLIKTGRLTGAGAEVLSGLSSGERIIVNGLEKVVDGARVQ